MALACAPAGAARRRGEDPVAALYSAATDRELDSTADRAAVHNWRLERLGFAKAGARTAPSVPARIASDLHWGAYFNHRTHLVDSFAEQVHERATERVHAGTLGSLAQNGIRPDAGHARPRRSMASGPSSGGLGPPTHRRTPTSKGLSDLAALLHRRATGKQRSRNDGTWSIRSHPRSATTTSRPLLAERLVHVPRRHTSPTIYLRECLFVDKCAGGLFDLDARR